MGGINLLSEKKNYRTGTLPRYRWLFSGIVTDREYCLDRLSDIEIIECELRFRPVGLLAKLLRIFGKEQSSRYRTSREGQCCSY